MRRIYARKSCMLLSALCLVAIAAHPVFAADHYVRAGATGNGSGADWDNAYQQLPATLIRGDTYYIADGSYPSYAFDDPVSGTQCITIKKATASDHGINAGWQADYGDGQAEFTAPATIVTFSTGYWVFDGVTGAGKDSASYGFKLKTTSTTTTIYGLIRLTGTTDGCSFRHIELDGNGVDLPYARDGIYATNNPFGLHLSHLYIHDFTRMMITLTRATDLVVERSVFLRNHNTSGIHAQAVQLTSSTNATFRYNWFENITNTGVIITIMSTYPDHNQNLYVYGNTFITTDPYYNTGRVMGDANNCSTRGLRFHNNTIIHLNTGSNSGSLLFDGAYSEDNLAYNNIWFNSNVGMIGTTHDYNTLINSSYSYGSSQTEHEEVISGDPFVNSAGGDFHLRTSTSAGLILDPPYTIDPDQLIRGADGTWDRGAYEYVPLHYVRADAPAGGDGLTWDTAWQQLPATLVRGHTYYIADGTYGSYTFDDTVDGEKYITLRKATVQDHGFSTGWNDTLAGQAVFQGEAGNTLRFVTGYYEVDGVVGEGADNSSYGFKVEHSAAAGAAVNILPGVSHITIGHTEVENYGYSSGTGADRSITMISTGTNPPITDIALHHNWLHKVEGVHLYLYKVYNLMVEKCWFTERLSADTFGVHGESFTVYESQGHTYRFNTFRNVEGTGIIVLQSPTGSVNNRDFDIYGNVFYNDAAHIMDGCSTNGCDGALQPVVSDFDVTNGTITDTGTVAMQDIRIYNNTFVDLTGPAGIAFNNAGTSGVIARNNLWVDCGSPTVASAITASDNIFNGNAAIFEDYPNHDFSLAAASPAGMDVTEAGKGFHIDPAGETRGIDGTWDIGAYEYVEAGAGIVYGDVSENGTISAYDASLTAQYAAGLIALTQSQLTKAEVSGNGTVSAYDASLIAQKAAGLIDKFPVEP